MCQNPVSITVTILLRSRLDPCTEKITNDLNLVWAYNMFKKVVLGCIF